MGNLSVVGLQWGDEGKGKVVDYLAGEFDAVVRFNGGSNAGHTVVLGTKKHTFHLIPSGALKGKELLIGAGVALDPLVLAEELTLLPSCVRERLVVDGKCTLVSPLERKFDGLLEEMRGSSAIGTTNRGIGPSYAMRAFRLAPRVIDLLVGIDFKSIRRFYSEFGIHSLKLSHWAADSRHLLKDLVGDVSFRIEDICAKGGSVLFEASQGTLLDLLHGTYPFVTGSHTTVGYIPPALGIPPSLSGEPLGVVKCYTTRIGSGPLPTEVKGDVGDSIRRLGIEYGSTTGRPRRIGWLDLVSLKYAVRLNGVKKIALTKLDVLAGIREFKICTAYSDNGTETVDFQKSLGRLDRVKPVYESPLSMFGASFETGLPRQAKKFVDYLERELGVKVILLSHGDERSKTIVL